uniref:Uncharacterized protein n=1 Tax=Anguilla anguilla TaxID=7936 RepID=A0A0E9UW08_ANGAN
MDTETMVRNFVL